MSDTDSPPARYAPQPRARNSRRQCPGWSPLADTPSRTATLLAPLARDIGCSLAGVAGVQLPPSLAGGKS